MTEQGAISTKKAWTIILVSLIDDFVILAAVIGVLWYFKVKLPLWAMVVIGLVLGSYIFVRTWAVLPSIRRRKMTGAEGMIGMEAEVVETLNPTGVIRVEGELWKAKSLDGEITACEMVEIQSVKKLMVEVRRKGC